MGPASASVFNVRLAVSPVPRLSPLEIARRAPVITLTQCTRYRDSIRAYRRHWNDILAAALSRTLVSVRPAVRMRTGVRGRQVLDFAVCTSYSPQCKWILGKDALTILSRSQKSSTVVVRIHLFVYIRSHSSISAQKRTSNCACADRTLRGNGESPTAGLRVCSVVSYFRLYSYEDSFLFNISELY